MESPIAGAAFDRCQSVSGFALPMIPVLGGHSQRRRHRNARPRGDRNAHLPRGKLETHLNTCHGGAPTRGTPPSQTASGTEGWPLSPCHSERGRRPDAPALPARLARNPPGSLTPELASTASAFFGWGRQRGLGRSGQFHGGFREPRIPVPPRLADVGSRPPPFARDREHPDVVERVERSETAGRPMDPRAARGGCGRSVGRVPEGSGGASLPREPRRESSGAVAAASAQAVLASAAGTRRGARPCAPTTAVAQMCNLHPSDDLIPGTNGKGPMSAAETSPDAKPRRKSSGAEAAAGP